MSNKFYLLIAGSRTFTDYELMDRKLSKILDRVGVEFSQIVLVHGGARGADSLADRLAHKCGWEVKVFPADWNQFGKSAGYRRNREMHEFLAKHKNRGCVCFWDGKSRGTQHNFELCKEFGTPLRVIRFDKEESKGSSPVFERLSETGNAMEKTYTFQTFANDGHKKVCITVRGYCDNSDCNAPGEHYIISYRYTSREKARQIYKDCLNAGFKKPWYDKIDWSDKASK